MSSLLANHWNFPLDPECPAVRARQERMTMDPMNYSIPSDVLRDLAADWARSHRRRCARCQEYGAANVEVAE